MDIAAQKDPRRQAAMNDAAAQRYWRDAAKEYAKGKGDIDETRRLLEKAMGYAERAGDRRLMSALERDIMLTFNVQKAAAKEAVAENAAALRTLSGQLNDIKMAAAGVKVTIDTAQADAALDQLRRQMAGLGIGVHVAGSAAMPKASSAVTVAGTATTAARPAASSGSVGLPASSSGAASAAGVTQNYSTNVNAPITMTLPPWMSNIREMARAVVDELARLDQRNRTGAPVT